MLDKNLNDIFNLNNLAEENGRYQKKDLEWDEPIVPFQDDSLFEEEIDDNFLEDYEITDRLSDDISEVFNDSIEESVQDGINREYSLFEEEIDEDIDFLEDFEITNELSNDISEVFNGSIEESVQDGINSEYSLFEEEIDEDGDVDFLEDFEITDELSDDINETFNISDRLPDDNSGNYDDYFDKFFDETDMQNKYGPKKYEKKEGFDNPEKSSIYNQYDSENEDNADYMGNQKSSITAYPSNFNKDKNASSMPSSNKRQKRTDRSGTKENNIVYYAKKYKEVYSCLRINNSLCQFDGRAYKVLDRESMIKNFLKIDKYKDSEEFKHYSILEDTYKYLCVSPDIEWDDLQEMEKKSEHKISFKNCVFDTKKRKLYKHSDEFILYHSIQAKFVQGKELSTPYFDKFIYEVTDASKETYRLIYEAIGYLMIHSQAAKCFFIFGTAPNSGKGVISSLLTELFGRENIFFTALHQMGGRFALGNLHKKSLCISMDLPNRVIDDKTVSNLKTLTGDPIVATEQKYEPVRDTKHHCKFVYGSNFPLKIKSDDEAFWNRVVYIPFIKSIPKAKQDHDLISKILMEKDRIATKAAYAVGDLIKRNYMFSPSRYSMAQLEKWRGYDELGINLFINSVCEFRENAFTPTAELHEAYLNYCYDNDVSVIIQEKNSFSRIINERYDIKLKKMRLSTQPNPVNGYCGISLKSNSGYSKASE